jgi:hypothetical protein
MPSSIWAGYALLALAQVSRVVASPNCPIPGPQLPAPQRLTQNPIWIDAMKNLSAVLDGWEAYAQNFSFSIQVFSTNPGDNEIIFERFHTQPTLPANTTGVKKVDQNTVYRLGSISKLFTVMTLLSKTGDQYFNDPITKWVPELAAIQANQSNTASDHVRTVDWDDVSIWTLAAQMSGLGRDCKSSREQLTTTRASLMNISKSDGLLGEVTQNMNLNTAQSVGFPPLESSEVPPCGDYPLCNRTRKG